jgi:membrane associated rhomboid family serine protease
MFLPLKDDNPLRIIPYQYATIGIIGLCALTFLWQLSLTSAEAERTIGGLAVVPTALFGGRPDLSLVPPAATLVTSLFLHGGWLHLISNMLYLWVFGDNIEDLMGHGRFVAFFLVCGAVGGLAHAVANSDSVAPTIGASGAVFGVLGAYLLLHPRVRVLVLVFKWFPISLPPISCLAAGSSCSSFPCWAAPALSLRSRGGHISRALVPGSRLSRQCGARRFRSSTENSACAVAPGIAGGGRNAILRRPMPHGPGSRQSGYRG